MDRAPTEAPRGNRASPAVEKAFALSGDGRTADAIALLRGELARSPDSAELKVVLASLLWEGGDETEAVELLERAQVEVLAAKAGPIDGALASPYDRLGRADVAIAAWAGMLVVMAVLSAVTGGRMAVLPMSLCPIVKTVAAVMIVVGTLA
jgi:predicted Zn-dependent protease